MLKKIALLLMLTILLTNCSHRKFDENNAESVFQDIELDIEDSYYDIALNRLREFKYRFPNSKYAIMAQLKIADVYFKQESYAEAAVSYQSFIELYPKHPKIVYSLYCQAHSHVLSLPSKVQRDLSNAQKALEAFHQLSQFSSSSLKSEKEKKEVLHFKQLAQKEEKELQETLAQKELEIADFYQFNKHYKAAQGRYDRILNLYPETAAAKKAKIQKEALPNEL